MSAPWPGFGSGKLPAHAAAYLKLHAIPEAGRRAAGIRYLTAAESASAVGGASDGLAVPFPGTGSGIVRQLGPETAPKFKAPAGWKPRMYCGPLRPKLSWKRVQKDPRCKLYWVEGPLKALCLTWQGVPAIAFNGLDGWSCDHRPIRDLAAFRWRGRVVVLLVDSDVPGKLEARRAIQRQADLLAALGASVKVVFIPALDRAAKTDVNDFVTARGVDALLKLPEVDLPADWSGHDATRELNRRHALVLLDGKTTVLTEDDDPDHAGTRKLALSRAADVRDVYANQLTETGTADEDGKRKPVTKFQVWLGDPKRREVRRIWFRPGTPWGLDPKTGDFNLWQGWALQPDPRGSWKRLREHVHEVIADGDAAVARYVFDWMAHGIQHPATLPETAIVTIGGEGTGKGILWRSLGKLYGRHFMHLVQKSQLVGNFNDHHKDKLLVYADESFYAGDHQAAGVLKAMITEPTMMIEPKYVNAYQLPNYRRLVISSNETWVVPAGTDARRFAVLRVSERRKADHGYFQAIMDELNERAGYAALLNDLLHRDLTGFDPRRIPSTGALLDQKKLTWDPITAWWFEKLVAGTFGASPDGAWESWCWASAIRHDVDQQLASRFDRMRSFETAVGMELRRLCPGVKRERRTNDTGKRDWSYTFPPLARCRAAFETFTRTPIDWETGELKRETRR